MLRATRYQQRVGIVDVIVGFIRSHKDQPFFLYVAHQTPHNPYQTRADTPENRKEGWKPNSVSEENRPRYEEMVKVTDPFSFLG